jgi:hypothetical protein
VDTRWESEQDWHSPQGCSWTDFSRYPTLGKYLDLVRFHPCDGTSGGGGVLWIAFPARCGFYSEQTMVAALLVRLEDKIQKYAAQPLGLSEFHLLVHYDLAWEYNTPAETPTFKFEDDARAAVSFIGDDPGVFDRIFLFVPHNEAQQVFQLYPGVADSR